MNMRKIGYFVAVVSAVVALGCAKQPKTTDPQVTNPAVSTATPTEATGARTVGGATAGGSIGAGSSARGGGSEEKIEPINPANVATRPEVKQFTATPRLRDIHFDFDEYVIRPEDSKILDADVDWIQSNPSYLILIEGHCDERGTNEYNLALGEHRARATMSYLMSHGVQAERITTLSYGEERPACVERTDACWALNRRAHFLVKLAKPQR